MSLITGSIAILIYLILGVCFINFIIGAFYSKTHKKLFRKLLFSTIALLLVVFLLQCEKSHDSDFEHLGTYRLIKYPNCDSCKLILLIDNKFKVVNGNNLVESGIWEQEESSDFDIVYLNNGKNQLGIGIYEFTNFEQTKL